MKNTMKKRDEAATDVAEVVAALGLKTDMGREAMKLAVQFVRLLDQKQEDYGSANIIISGEQGVIVRSQDKICRLKNLLGKSGVNHESVSDSWMDLANYGIIGFMVHNKIWK